MRQRKPCSICGDPQVGHELCGKHYQRWRKYGDPLHVEPNRGNRSVRVTPVERTCRVCGHVGPRSDFQSNRNTCKTCARAKLRQWQAENPERVAAMRERAKTSGARVRWNIRSRARMAGLNPDWFEGYYAEHDGKCAICGRRPRPGGKDLAIDHDHATGDFRGMLCDHCNRGLGYFRDDPRLLRQAIRYLASDIEARGYPPIVTPEALKADDALTTLGVVSPVEVFRPGVS